MISFCTTATVRPEIISRCYQSLHENFIGLDWQSVTLFINIDPIPTREFEPMLTVAKKYFGKIVYNVPKEPNFTRAVEWCWKNADTDIICHLEDDWVLLKRVEYQQICKYFNKNKDLRQLVLNRGHRRYSKMCLSPSFIHKEFYKRFVGNLDYNINPEIQLSANWIKPRMIHVFGKRNMVVDIGRKWLRRQKFKKPNAKVKFTKWEFT